MLTLFTIPKAFLGHFDIIQRNAIQSWMRLKPVTEIILFGNEIGTREIAIEFNLKHIPDIERNEFGTPLVSDLFKKGEKYAANDWIGYINADVILMRDFAQAIKRISRQRSKLLVVGQRWDIGLDRRLDFKSGWEENMKDEAMRQGRPYGTGSDYYIFKLGLWPQIPPFAIGRFWWDLWLMDRAYRDGFPVIDATAAIMALHQKHGYAHFRQEDLGQENTPEALNNFELLGGHGHKFIVRQATHCLTLKRLRLVKKREFIRNRLRRQTMPVRRKFPHLFRCLSAGYQAATFPVRVYDSLTKLHKRLQLSQLGTKARNT